MAKEVMVPAAAASRMAAAAAASAGDNGGVVNGTAPSTSNHNINFGDVFAELQKYKQENNGSLAIPSSHPVVTAIIDSLFESTQGVEGLFKKRWEEQLIALKDFKDNFGDINVPKSYPTLGNWVRVQREQFALYEQRMPNALTKKRYDKLKALGFGSEELPDESDSSDENNNHLDTKPMHVSKKEESSDEGEFNTNDSEHWSNQSTPEKEPRKKLSEGDGPVEIEASKKGGKKSKKLKGGSVEEETSGDMNIDQISKKGDSVGSNDKVDEFIAPLNDTTSAKNDGTTKVSKKLKGKCDVCEKRDGFWGHNLQQCKECHVLVHELCYGLTETKTKNPNFVCHACKAVGQSIEVNVPSKIGGPGNKNKIGQKREMIQQGQRPTECLLCSHNKGIHAMHPLLDMHGPEGRQLCVKTPGRGGGKSTKKLAWVHTLCAGVISANPRTNSAVYGCDKNGRCYEDYSDASDEDEYIDEEDRKLAAKKTKKKNTANEDEGESGAKTVQTRYYCIATEDGYAQNIKEHRGLKCFICGHTDKKFRIPIQCPAGDEEEYHRWKNRHRKGTECYVAMHVGCARWGCVKQEGSHIDTFKGKRCKLCYFTPGRYVGDDDVSSKGSDDDNTDENETVAHCYCKAHAREIVKNNPERKKKTNKVPSPRPEKKPANVSGASFKKSMNSISKSGGVPLKKKTSAGKSQENAFGADPIPLKKRSSKGNQPGATDAIPLGRKSSAGDPQGEKLETDPVPLKRKSSGGNPSGPGVGSIPKKAKVGFVEENSVQYPFKGRSASALAGSTSSNHHLGNGAAARSGMMHGALGQVPDSVPSGILKNATKSTPAPAPDLPTSGPAAELKRNTGMATKIVVNDESSGKRKSQALPDLPTSGNFKRMRMED